MINFREIENPFQPNVPIQREKVYLHKGRGSETCQILSSLEHAGKNVFVVHGPPSCGKTSLLRTLSHHLSRSLLFTYVDLDRSAMPNSDVEFCYALARSVFQSSLQVRGVTLISPNHAEFSDDSIAAIETWLAVAKARLAGRRLVLALDGLDRLAVMLKAGRLSEVPLNWLRAACQREDKFVSLVAAAARPPAELGAALIDCFAGAVHIEMGYLAHEDAVRLLTAPVPDFGLCYAEGIAERIARITAGHPTILHTVGSALVEYANKHQTARVDAAFMEAALAALAVSAPDELAGIDSEVLVTWTLSQAQAGVPEPNVSEPSMPEQEGAHVR